MVAGDHREGSHPYPDTGSIAGMKGAHVWVLWCERGKGGQGKEFGLHSEATGRDVAQ